MPSSPDVVIIGGGIIGCSTAYHLAKAGARVTILERESIGCEASGAATGALSVLSIDQSGPFVELAWASVRLYEALAPELREASGIDFYYGPMSRLELAFSQEDEAANREAISWKASLVPKVSWLLQEDIRRLEHRASPLALSGLYFEGLRQVDPYRLTLAFARASESLGVRIRYSEATGLRIQGGRVCEVYTPHGEVACEALVIAMGAWTGLVEGWMGVNIPVEPLKGQVLQLAFSGPPLACHLYHASNYIAFKLEGIILAGTFDGLNGYDKGVSQEGRRSIMEGALRICPDMEKATIVSDVVGLRPLARDGIPILGAVPGLDNAYVATGHGRKGITTAAMTGRLMAQLAIGQPPEMDMSPFNPARFITSKAPAT